MRTRMRPGLLALGLAVCLELPSPDGDLLPVPVR